MADIVSPQKRSEMMSGIRSKDTKPEMLIRKALHSRGFRYRLHSKTVAGKPDLFLPKHNAAIFIHGCFWHQHSCHLFKWPKSREDFWRKKIVGNLERDNVNRTKLDAEGVRVLIVWECATKGKTRLGDVWLIEEVVRWLESGEKYGQIEGLRGET